jgi:hypothetical protein
VLEWTNPDCPFVRKHYDSKNMQDLQKEWGAKDVVWLSVNSTRQGHYEYRDGQKMQEWMTSQGAAQKAILIDAKSEVGSAVRREDDAAHVRDLARGQGALQRRDRRQAQQPTRPTRRPRTTTSAPR